MVVAPIAGFFAYLLGLALMFGVGAVLAAYAGAFPGDPSPHSIGV